MVFAKEKLAPVTKRATWDVAQVANLRYRRLPVGSASQIRPVRRR